MIEIDEAPVPPTLDVSTLPGFLLNMQKLFASRLWARSTGDEFKAAVALWGAAWQQVPAGSLPDDERELASYSRAGGRWKKLRAVALHGFVKCRADGRLYHPVLCADALRAHAAREQRRKAIETRWGRQPKRERSASPDTAVAAPKDGDPNARASTDDTARHDSSLRSAESPPTAQADESRVARGTRLPRDWCLPQEWLQFALAEGMTAAVAARTAEDFRDYWIAQPGQRGVKLDWLATWRRWVRQDIGGAQHGRGSRALSAEHEATRARNLAGVLDAFADELGDPGETAAAGEPPRH